MGPALVVLVLIYLGIVGLMIASMWKIFVKAGKPGWASITPFYNFIVFLEIVGKPTWWFILLFIPPVNLVIGVMLIHRLSLSFGKDKNYTAGLLFLGVIYCPLLAFSGSRYVGPGGKPQPTPVQS